MKKLISGLLGAALSSSAAWGAVKLPQFITDNMVVQQNSTLRIPGHATPGATVKARADWNNGASTSTKADAEGRFMLSMPTPAAGGPFTLIIDDDSDEPAVLSNLLAGEVWICSGQSNMEFPVKGWTEVMGSDQVVATAQHPAIRLLQVRKNRSFVPLDDAEVNMGGWVAASPATMDFSAIAYLFALRMQKELGVPVGVIDCSWGGTPAEAWTGIDALRKVDGFQYAIDAMTGSNFREEGINEAFSKSLADWTDKVKKLDLDFPRDEMQTGDGWGRMPVPGFWENSVLANFDGAVWMQRELTLPDDAAGKPLQLKVGRIDNMDDTYFNGVRVGGVDNHKELRCYEVAGNLVKGGKNVISIRVIDFDGAGGITGAPEEIAATVDGKSYPLSGNWTYKVAGSMRDLPVKPANPASSHYPSVLYNAMLHPVSVLPVKGVLWYQGCTNVGRDEQYASLFKELIKDWRGLYGNPDMPFYFVQLAGYLTPVNVQPDSEWAALRNAQAKALELPNTGMAVAIDLGNPADIHPVNKQDVANRLALLALNHTYGKEDVVAEAPRCISSNAADGKIILRFNGPVTSDSGVFTGFIIGDASGKFAYARSEHPSPDTIVLSSPLISNPIAARYNWADYPDGNMYGSTGLPVAPFATDK